MLDRPIFVLGCGRSGTTILGMTIGSHRNVAYLNEPRAIWFDAFPQSDIWTEQASARGGKIVLDESDWTPEGAERLSAGFATALTGVRTRFCEKLPINNFRVRLIDRIFPDALFIYIEREPVAVAKSISKKIQSGGWLGSAGYKWKALTEAAAAVGIEGDAEHCQTPLQKGAYEWAVSTRYAKMFLATISDARVFRMTYDGFTTNPGEALRAIEDFAGLPRDEDAEHAAQVSVRRPLGSQPIDPAVSAIISS
jgi:hypothetical protein